jgi:hypothetical protein
MCRSQQMQTILLLCAIMNSGIAVYMYIARHAVTNFSSNGVQQLKGYFSNNDDSYILAVFGFLFYLCSTPTMFSTKFKMKISCTGCPRRNVRDFGRVFLMLNYTDITQNTYIQSWTVTEIVAIEKCGLVGCPRTVRRPWRHTRQQRVPGNETS